MASYTYDVFLSFRGPDTRHHFTAQLCQALRQRQIKTFMDDDSLTKGVNLSEGLYIAISGSKLSIIVFSQNYAQSSSCLDELAYILECQKSRNQMVRVIFYKVDPSDVRHQIGYFGAQLHYHLITNAAKLYYWKAALTQAANIAGSHYIQGYETTFIDNIVEEVSGTLGVNRMKNAITPDRIALVGIGAVQVATTMLNFGIPAKGKEKDQVQRPATKGKEKVYQQSKPTTEQQIILQPPSPKHSKQKVLDQNHAHTSTQQPFKAVPFWCTPKKGYLKINFHGAFNGSKRKGGIGIVARDSSGRFVAARCFGLSDSESQDYVQAFAAHQGLFLAEDLGFARVCFEGDSLTLVHAVNSGSSHDDYDETIVFGQIIKQICSMLRSLDRKCSFSQIHSGSNGVAGALATYALSNSEKCCWFEPPEFIHNLLSADHCSWETTCKSVCQPQHDMHSIRWRPPSKGSLKLNVGGVYSPNRGIGGAGVVVRDRRGKVKVAMALRLGDVSSPEHVEILAISSGLKLAYDYKEGYSSVVLESDAQQVMDALNNGGECFALEWYLVHEAMSCLKPFERISCDYIPRQCNKIAHELAMFALSSRTEKNLWTKKTTPCWLNLLLQNDVSGI